MPHYVKPPKTKQQRWQEHRDRVEARKAMTPEERIANKRASKPDFKTRANPGGTLEALPMKDR